jgi:eukaryotic-like serine/threonine-protein kinase
MKLSQQELMLLLSVPEDSDAFRSLAQRLEESPEEQKSLVNLSLSDANWWRDAKAALESGELPTSHELIDTQTVSFSTSGTAASVNALDEDVDRTSSDLAQYLAPPSHPELLGRLGRYDVERIVGRGGMGVVFKAYDSELHRVVAIKAMVPHLASSQAARKRFAREARAIAAIAHPHVIPILDVQSEASLPYLVMQYVHGQSLQSRIEASGPLPVADALRVAQQTASGLAAAHEHGLVHRDVKPANILMEESVERVLLSDFGLARTIDDASLTRTGIVTGTPHYMSPEQADSGTADPRSDLFSLGSVIYFMLTGHPPFRAQSMMATLNRICHSPHRPLVQVNADVPFEVARLVDRLLAKEPNQRFQSAKELDDELTKLLSSLQQGGLSLRPRRVSKNVAVSRLAWLVPTLFVVGIFVVLAKSVGLWGTRSNSVMEEISQQEDIRESTVHSPQEVTQPPSWNELAQWQEQSNTSEQEWQSALNQLRAQTNQLRQRWESDVATSTDDFSLKSSDFQKKIQQLLNEPTSTPQTP